MATLLQACRNEKGVVAWWAGQKAAPASREQVAHCRCNAKRQEKRAGSRGGRGPPTLYVFQCQCGSVLPLAARRSLLSRGLGCQVLLHRLAQLLCLLIRPGALLLGFALPAAQRRE